MRKRWLITVVSAILFMVLGMESSCTKKDEVAPAATGSIGLVGGTWDLTSLFQSVLIRQ